MDILHYHYRPQPLLWVWVNATDKNPLISFQPPREISRGQHVRFTISLLPLSNFSLKGLKCLLNLQNSTLQLEFLLVISILSSHNHCNCSIMQCIACYYLAFCFSQVFKIIRKRYSSFSPTFPSDNVSI